MILDNRVLVWNIPQLNMRPQNELDVTSAPMLGPHLVLSGPWGFTPVESFAVPVNIRHIPSTTEDTDTIIFDLRIANALHRRGDVTTVLRYQLTLWQPSYNIGEVVDLVGAGYFPQGDHGVEFCPSGLCWKPSGGDVQVHSYYPVERRFPPDSSPSFITRSQ